MCALCVPVCLQVLEAFDGPLMYQLKHLGAAECHFAYRMVVVMMRRDMPMPKVSQHRVVVVVLVCVGNVSEELVHQLVFVVGLCVCCGMHADAQSTLNTTERFACAPAAAACIVLDLTPLLPTVAAAVGGAVGVLVAASTQQCA